MNFIAEANASAERRTAFAKMNEWSEALHDLTDARNSLEVAMVAFDQTPNTMNENRVQVNRDRVDRISKEYSDASSAFKQAMRLAKMLWTPSKAAE